MPRTFARARRCHKQSRKPPKSVCAGFEPRAGAREQALEKQAVACGSPEISPQQKKGDQPRSQRLFYTASVKSRYASGGSGHSFSDSGCGTLTLRQIGPIMAYGQTSRSTSDSDADVSTGAVAITRTKCEHGSLIARVKVMRSMSYAKGIQAREVQQAPGRRQYRQSRRWASTEVLPS